MKWRIKECTSDAALINGCAATMVNRAQMILLAASISALKGSVKLLKMDS